MAHRSQCSSAGDNPLDANYLPPHYREEYRLAIDALVEENLEGYFHFLQLADVVDFLSPQEIKYIQSSVQVPHEGNYGDQQRCLQEFDRDSSSDTYWPVHSDLDAPDLDLGWPQLNRFIGPTEVTTLVNPAEHDMPSIKEQARRLIRNAQQVVAIVMDMFTDVDILAEVLDATMRNVAVYILLDEGNAHHFVNMLSNCRVNLDSIQNLRVRTVSGISYQCRSGKTLKGQMMDRFLLTDCRAVLSGNYSFMWSFEKLHRCLAHLFLGQLVSTFDEEFRILFAQSQPLKIDNLPAPMEDFAPLPERQYLSDRAASFRESRTYATADNPCQDEWPRHTFDERIDTDWRRMSHNRHESTQRSLDPQGAADIYKNPSQQLRIGQTYDQSSSQIPLNMMESQNFKRHSYAEGIPGRQTVYQPMQQPGMANFERQGRPFHRSYHAPPRAGLDAGYSAYDKLRSHAYPPGDPYTEPALPHEMELPENFELVHNYLSSTDNVEMDQKFTSGSPHLKRRSLGQPHAHESALPPNPPEQTQIIQATNMDRKDPAVRQGLRNWRINSYLNTFDNAGDEEMPLPPNQASDPFEETPNPSSGPDLSTTKFPNTREFKVPVGPRGYPSYRKSTVPEPSEKYTEDFLMLAAQAKMTPSTSESSLTEADKTDEMEQQDPKDIRPEESFRRKHNVTVPRSSRLRSSLIFSSQLEQPVPQDDGRTTARQQDEDTDKAEGTQGKVPFALQVLSRRTAKEPFEWSRYARPATIDNPLTEPSKADDVENKESIENITVSKPLKDSHKNPDIVAASKPIDVPLLRPSTSQCELSKLDRPVLLSESLLENPFVDMNDADNRLMFFKQLAAKRKAEKLAASAKGNTDKVVLQTQTDPKNTTVKIEQPTQKKIPDDPVVVASCGNEQSSVATDSEKLELKKSQTQVSTSIKESTRQSANELESLKHKTEPSSKESSSPDPSYAEQPGSSKSALLEINTSSPNSSGSSTAHNPIGVESSLSLSAPLVPSSSSEQIQSDVATSKNTTRYPSQTLTAREPFKWNRNVRSDIFSSTIKKPLKVETAENIEETESSSGVKHPENSDSTATSKATEVEQAIAPFVLRPSTSQIELSKTDQPVPPPQSLLGNPTVDMSDADLRLPVAAQLKAEKAAAAKAPAKVSVSMKTDSDSKVTNEEPAVQETKAEGTTGYSKKGETTLCKTALDKNVTKDVAQLTPTDSPTVDYEDVQSKTVEQKKQSQNNPVPMASCENEKSSVTLDSEKMELKKSQNQESTSIPDPSQSTISSQPLEYHNLLEPSVKDGSQLPPSIAQNTFYSELSHVTSPTESTKQSANELESLKHESSLKESSSTSSSSTEQPEFPTSAPLEINTPSTPIATAQSVPSVPNASDSSASENTTDPPPPLSQPFSTMAPSTTLESNPTDYKTIDIAEPVESLSLPSLESFKTSSQTPEEATQSSPAQTVLSSDVETIKPQSINVPEISTTLESGDAESKTSKACESPSCSLSPSSKTELRTTESNTSSESSESHSKPNIALLQTPSETLPEEPCSLPPSSKMELPKTESSTSSESSGKHSKPNTPLLQTPSETLPEDLCTLPLSSNMELSETESNSVALESSSSTVVLPSQEDVEDKANASLSIRLSPPCPVDPTENSESLICNIKKEPVDSPKLNADTPSEETKIEKKSNPDFPPSILALSQPPPDSDGSVVFSKPETMAIPTLPIPTPSEVAPKLSSPDLEKTPIPLVLQSLSDIQTKPTLEVSLNLTPDQTKPTLSCDVTIESKPITSESCPSEPKVTTEKGSVSIPCEVSNKQGQPDTTAESKTSEAKPIDTITTTILQDSAYPEKLSDQTKMSASVEKVSSTTIEQAAPLSPQSKQPKATQARYHSSTANVISSSNLRDDTKLLLGQISANSQNRNEPVKELSVTDDDKESEADKNVIGQKDGGSKFKHRGTTKTPEERQVLLQKIQNMRKEGKVYSRFEMPP